jgi:hypothetical protein
MNGKIYQNSTNNDFFKKILLNYNAAESALNEKVKAKKLNRRKEQAQNVYHSGHVYSRRLQKVIYTHFDVHCSHNVDFVHMQVRGVVGCELQRPPEKTALAFKFSTF